MSKEKTAVYTRVSTDKEEQKHSLQSQIEHYTEYAEQKGYELINVYTDEGTSATSPKREQFLEMLRDAGLDVIKDEVSGEIRFRVSDREPKFNYIITKDASRFARNINGVDIARKLRDKRVYIIFENMGFTTQDNDWEFRLSLFLTFSQQESIDKSEKLTKAYLIRAKKGKFHMPNILFGFYRDKETKEYLIHEEEAKTVRDIFHWYVYDKEGTTTIAKKLNANKVTTKQGKEWKGYNVKRIINNEKYKGLVILNRITNSGITSANKKVKRDESEWIYLYNAIPAIIETEIWDEAQEIMSGRVKDTKDGKKTGAKIVKNIFHQKIICSKCKATFVRVSGTKKREGKKVIEYTYYCRNRRHKGTCDMRGVSHGVLEREVMKLANGAINNMINNVNNPFYSIETERETVNEILKALEFKKGKIEEERALILGQIDEVAGNIEKLFNKIISIDDNPIFIELTKEEIAKRGEEKKKLNEELMKTTTIEIDKQAERVKKQLEKVEEIAKKDKFTFQETLNLIDEIVVAPDRNLTFSLKTPTVFPYVDGYYDNPEIIKNQTMTAVYRITY